MNTPIYEHHRRNLRFQYDDRKFDLRAIYVDLRACGPVVYPWSANVDKIDLSLHHQSQPSVFDVNVRCRSSIFDVDHRSLISIADV